MEEIFHLIGPTDSFTPWVPWSACSLTCNGGTQTRSRVCIEAQCSGPTTDSRDCNTQPCPSKKLEL